MSCGREQQSKSRAFVMTEWEKNFHGGIAVSNQITPISISHGRGLQPTGPVIFMIILLAWIGLPVVAWPPPYSLIAEAVGACRIKVCSPKKTASAGRYEIKIEALREATAEDKYRVAAESVFRDAGHMRNGTLEDKRKSIEKYHKAVDLYRKAGDRKWEAITLANIGETYYLLGETQKALEKFNQAVPIFQAIGDRRSEAITRRKPKPFFSKVS
jgi:hypothetical protein